MKTIPYPRLWLKKEGYYVPPYRTVPDDRPRGSTLLAPWRTEGMPRRWTSKLNGQLQALLSEGPPGYLPSRIKYVEDAWRSVEAVASAVASAVADQVLPPTASDDELVTLAEKCADECAGDAVRYRDPIALRRRCEVIASRVRVPPLGPEVRTRPALMRYADRRWWTRRLRTAHGRAIEEAAIRIGIVHRRSDVYVSDDGLARHLQAQRRNARILAATKLANEEGEVFTLAELAERSVSNKAIRRGELMLRIRGMEEVATGAGRVALFAVLTAPGSMHSHLDSGHPNPRHDGSTPREVQAWHAANWKRMTAALHRAGIGFYGARTVEPHHDGTPHWNVLLFLPADQVAQVKWLFRRYWLHDWSPTERGAIEHRLKLTDIDPDKGSATSYIAKYIAKGIDGQGMREDLFGNPIIETSTRIEAWARIHGIRQFQTMCSASVMVWRELRRIPRDVMISADPPENLIVAWNACQRVAASREDPGKRADFAEYIKACGGPRVKRADRQLVLDFKAGEGETRYGEPAPDIPAGVAGAGIVHRWREPGGICDLALNAAGLPLADWIAEKRGERVAPRPIRRFRIEYEEGRTAVVPSLRRKWTALPFRGGAVGVDVGLEVPRTRVNNYTRPSSADGRADNETWSEEDTEGIPIGYFRGRGPPRGARVAGLDPATLDAEVLARGVDPYEWKALRELESPGSAW